MTAKAIEAAVYESFRKQGAFLPQTVAEVERAERECNEESVVLPPSLRDPMSILKDPTHSDRSPRMSILIQSREPVAPPLPDRDVWSWNIPGMKNAVVVEQRPSGYAVAGPLLFPDNPFVSEPLNATTTADAIAEARNHVVAVLTRRAEDLMALANAFAGEVDDDDDDSTMELDQAEVAAAMAVALWELQTAYPAGV